MCVNFKKGAFVGEEILNIFGLKKVFGPNPTLAQTKEKFGPKPNGPKAGWPKLNGQKASWPKPTKKPL